MDSPAMDKYYIIRSFKRKDMSTGVSTSQARIYYGYYDTRDEADKAMIRLRMEDVLCRISERHASYLTNGKDRKKLQHWCDLLMELLTNLNISDGVPSQIPASTERSFEELFIVNGTISEISVYMALPWLGEPDMSVHMPVYRWKGYINMILAIPELQ